MTISKERMRKLQGHSFFDRRRQSLQTRRQDRIFLAFLSVIIVLMMLGAGGLILVRWLGATDGFRLTDVSSWPVWGNLGPENQQHTIHYAPIPLAEVPIVPQGIKRQIDVDPQSVCAFIQARGFATEGWQREGNYWDGWECLGDRDIVVNGEIKANVFQSIRGTQIDKIDALRFKFNLPSDNEGRKAYGERAANLSIVPLFDLFNWNFPSDIKDRILNLEPFDTVMDGVRIQLFEEFQSNRRVNLMLTMPRAAFPYSIQAGRVRTSFTENPIVKAQRIRDLRAIRKGRYSPVEKQSLIYDEEGILVPQEPEYETSE